MSDTLNKTNKPKVKKFKFLAYDLYQLINHNIFMKIKVNQMGLDNSVKFTKFMKECYKQHSKFVNKINEFNNQKNQELIDNNSEYKDLLEKFIKLRFDIAESNKFLNDHQELLPLLDAINKNNEEIKKFYEEVSKEEFIIECDFNINSLKLAIESTELTLEELKPLMCLFEDR